MKMLAALGAVWLLGGAIGGHPRITPLFSSREGAPAFMVECPNTAQRPIMSNAPHWELEYRLDGAVSDLKNSPGPGLGTLVQPGEAWRGILTLQQSEVGGAPEVVLGVRVRATVVHPMLPGRHTIALRCGGAWSTEAEFYWVAEASQ